MCEAVVSSLPSAPSTESGTADSPLLPLASQASCDNLWDETMEDSFETVDEVMASSTAASTPLVGGA